MCVYDKLRHLLSFLAHCLLFFRHIIVYREKAISKSTNFSPKKCSD